MTKEMNGTVIRLYDCHDTFLGYYTHLELREGHTILHYGGLTQAKNLNIKDAREIAISWAELAIEVPPNNKMCTKLEIVQLEIVAEGEGRGEYSGQNLILLRECKINTLKRVVHN